MVIVRKKGYSRVRNKRKEYIKPHSQGYYEGKRYPKRGKFLTSRHRAGINKTFWTKGDKGKFTGRIPVNSGKPIGDSTGIKNTDKRRIIGRLDSPYQKRTKELWKKYYLRYGSYPPKQDYRKL